MSEGQYDISGNENKVVITKKTTGEQRILLFEQTAIDYLGQPLNDLTKGLTTDVDIEKFLLVLSKDTNYLIDKQNDGIYISASERQSDDVLDKPRDEDEQITLDDILDNEDPERRAGSIQYALREHRRELLETPDLETDRRRKRPTTKVKIPIITEFPR